ncbi:lipopolysaccharide biosynthesis protein [Filimonas effusa]|uniref:Lipopolysaccharide biosynthesis protein n=1 Tax=Filimonas effusa TaxID=2508721 RepID=A0A4Q1DBJ5_9BACT|nr:lipopolysaccharide biosynthesis protein [Filimonas effusa]RXK86812.1 lipopolysaccharide biosynthesis protein [Filimonas effusa]
MAEVRKKTILSTVIIYAGFAIGALNTYLFSKQNFFTVEEYGLTRVFLDMVAIMGTLSMLGAQPAIYKFFPFYNRNLKKTENDLLSGALLWGMLGFLIILLAGWLGEDIFIRKFSARSPLLIRYYYWLFPAALFMGLYSVTEAFAWHLEKIAFTNFLRETLFRFITTVLIAIKLTGLISFHTFMICFALQYAIVAGILLYYLVVVQGYKLVFRISRVTRKFFKKMGTLISYVYMGNIVHTIANFLGAILIANTNGLAEAGIYTFANYFVTILQAPQRSIISISIPLLANAWKDKDMATIDRIYKRSSINMLLSSIFIFFIIWLCMDTAVSVFHINPSFLKGKWVFLIMSIYWIIELGTGVNAQIIGTSNDWRFEFFSGVILLSLTIPTNYFLVKQLGMIGAAYSGLISITIYNLIRIGFIWYKYHMQPFTLHTLKLLVIAFAAYGITLLCISSLSGLSYLIVACVVFSVLYLLPVYFLKITPDIEPVLQTLKKRLGLKK